MSAKRFWCMLLVCALLGALLPVSALAVPQEDFTMLATWSWEVPQCNAASISNPVLAEGNHERWIDRMADLPDFASSFYTWLEDNASSSGALADPTKGTNLNGVYVYKIETIQGSVNYRNFSGYSEKARAEAAIAADLGDLPNQIAHYSAEVFGAFDRDHSEVFWLSGSSTYGCGTSFTYGGGVANYTAEVYFFLKNSSFDLRKAEYQDVGAIQQGCQLIHQRVEQILANCKAVSDVDKIYYLNEVLTTTNAYNSAVGAGNLAAASPDAWECVSALDGKTGVDGPVCEGYARAFKVLCDAMEIPCVLAEGPAAVSANATPEGHMWNLVQVDGAWYAVDVTWNDPYSFGVDMPISGQESDDWLLLGSQTRFSTGLTFAQSHQETNKTTTESLQYTNGPRLAAEAYTTPVQVPTFKLRFPTLQLEDEIVLVIYFEMDQPELDLSQVGLLTWSTPNANVDISTAESVIWGAEFDAEQGLYQAFTEGIPAQELGDEIFFCVFAKLSDGSYVYSKQNSYCPVTYAYNQLSKDIDQANKALYVSMLNYGAAAQIYLNYRTDALVNNGLTEQAQSLVKEYQSDMVQSVTTPDSEKQGSFRKTTSGFSLKHATVSLEGAFAINYHFTPNETVNGDIRFYLWDQAAFSAAQTLSADNALDTFVLSQEDGQYIAAVQGIAAKDINRPLYVCAVYSDEAGNQYSSGILPYSLGYYCGRQILNGSEEIRPMAQAIAVYGYYAMTYFA